MKIGIGCFVTDQGIRPDVLARAVEERGFECLLLPEHSHIPVSRETPYPMGGDLPDFYRRLLHPFVSLATAATVTSRITLGTGIALLPQRDVIYTAKEAATLDHLSGGRLLFGVAAGWNREQMRNHGTDPGTRGALLGEQIDALKEIWTAEEAEYHGKFVDFDPIWAWPKPVQKPHPPIFVGGGSPAALRRVAEHGDGWITMPVPDVAGVRGQLQLAADHAPGCRITVFGADGTDLAMLDAYRDGGVERVALMLEPAAEAPTLRTLDALAPVAQRYVAR